jgi:hypothetical protein
MRGIEYFEGMDRLDFDAILILKGLIGTGNEPRLAFIETALMVYEKWWINPFLKLLGINQSSAEEKPNTYHAESAIDKALLLCVDAETHEDIFLSLKALKDLEDGGDYGSTHMLYGAKWLLNHQKISKQEFDSATSIAFIEVARKQKKSITNDLFYERVALSLWAGNDRHATRASIMRIIRAQNSDGGWSFNGVNSYQPSVQHSSCLALSALLLYKRHVLSFT